MSAGPPRIPGRIVRPRPPLEAWVAEAEAGRRIPLGVWAKRFGRLLDYTLDLEKRARAVGLIIR